MCNNKYLTCVILISLLLLKVVESTESSNSINDVTSKNSLQQQTRRRLTDQFEVVSGSCTTSGKCFESPNYPSNYGIHQTCLIKVLSVGGAEVLASTAFNTEAGYDELTINGTAYSGTAGPVGVAVSAGDSITWSSDDYMSDLGFQVCLGVTCAQMSGVTLNSGPCVCGGTRCTADSGLFCYADGSNCSTSALTICSIQDGSVTNNASCTCGSEKCTAASGLFCYASSNFCSSLASCDTTDGSAANEAASCKCGSEACTAASGLFCYALLNLCRQTDAIIPVPDLALRGSGASVRTTGLAKIVDDWIDEDNKGLTSLIESIYGLIQDWNTIKVTGMMYLFNNKLTFNADLSKWNVVNVTNMNFSTFQFPLFNILLSKFKKK